MDIVEEPHKYREISAVTLQVLSSTNLAISLWSHKNIDSIEAFTQPFSCQEFIRVSSEKLEKLIDERIKSVGINLKDLFDHLVDDVFIRSINRGILSRCFDSYSMYEYGILNFQTIARKLLSLDQANSLENFKIACVYLLEDCVSKIWVSVSSYSELREPNFANNHPAVCYWVDRMRNTRYVKNDIDHFLKFLMANQCYRHVKNYTKLYCNENLVRRLRKQLLVSIIRLPSALKYEKLLELSELVEGAFENDIEMKEFKKKLFFSYDFLGFLMNQLDRGFACEVQELTDVFVSRSDQDIYGVRKKFFERWQRFIIGEGHLDKFQLDRWEYFLWWCGVSLEGLVLYNNQLFLEMNPAFIVGWQTSVLNDRNKNTYDISQWKDIVMWFSFDERNQSTLKRDLEVDKIFEKLLHDAVSNLSEWLGSLETERSEPTIFIHSSKVSQELNLVDEFVLWYFGDDEKEIRNFKLKTINNFEEIPALKNVLLAKNECIVNDVLKWFFDTDVEKIHQFKSRLQSYD
ncbi:uncharacterized protein LOC135836859 [Planococcus citri]|uniref:uncharacterized protein LOC135836859 n=1 Tax=Planococcus citri TaxID=170843 RepID=UPI0031F78757